MDDGIVVSAKCEGYRVSLSLSQGKRKDCGPSVEYGGWYKACKVDR